MKARGLGLAALVLAAVALIELCASIIGFWYPPDVNMLVGAAGAAVGVVALTHRSALRPIERRPFAIAAVSAIVISLACAFIAFVRALDSLLG